MATRAVPARTAPGGMSLGELLGDTLRSPLAQALVLAAALGMFLTTFSPIFGWRDTFRGASLGFKAAPAFSLVDQQGQPTALADLTGGPVVLTFIYTSCTTACPLTTARMDQALAQLGKNAETVRRVAITVDPQRDGPAELRAFAERYRLDTSWRLLSGSADELQRVALAYHAQPIAAAAAGHEAHGGAPSGELLHPNFVLLIDRDGLQRFAYGPDFAPDDLAHDIKLLQRDLGGPNVPFPLY